MPATIPPNHIRSFRCPAATYDLLKQKAADGLYIQRTSRGISQFLIALADVPWECNPTLPVIKHPAGGIRNVALPPETASSYQAILDMYGIPPQDDPIGTALTNLGIGYFYISPTNWPTIVPRSYMANYNNTAPSPTRVSTTLFLTADTIDFLYKQPQGPSAYLITLATENTPLSDARPADLLILSETLAKYNVPPVWRLPDEDKVSLHRQVLSLPEHTIEYLLSQAESHNIPTTSPRQTRNTTIAAVIEAIARGYLSTKEPTNEPPLPSN